MITKAPISAIEDDPDLPRLVRVAGRFEASFAREFVEASHALRGAVDVAALETAFRSGRLTTEALDEAFRRVPQELTDRWRPTLQRVFGVGAVDAARDVPRSVDIRFDMLNAEASAWARRHAAERVVAVTETTREAIRDIAVDAVNGRMDVDDAARAIRGVVGLDPRRAQTVASRRAEWLEAGLSGDALQARVERLSDAYIRQRAKTIARTEIMTAANRGQEALWRAAGRQGLLRDPAQWHRQWLATIDDRTDPSCEQLDGETAPLNGGLFPGGVDGPPLHPRCRCTMRLVEVK